MSSKHCKAVWILWEKKPRSNYAHWGGGKPQHQLGQKSRNLFWDRRVEWIVPFQEQGLSEIELFHEIDQAGPLESSSWFWKQKFVAISMVLKEFHKIGIYIWHRMRSYDMNSTAFRSFTSWPNDLPQNGDGILTRGEMATALRLGFCILQAVFEEIEWASALVPPTPFFMCEKVWARIHVRGCICSSKTEKELSAKPRAQEGVLAYGEARRQSRNRKNKLWGCSEAELRAQGRVRGFWEPDGSLGGSRGTPEGAVSKALGAGKPAEVLGGPGGSLGTVRISSEAAAKQSFGLRGGCVAFGRQSRHRRSSQQSLRRREACRGFGGARRQSRNRKKKLGAKPPRDGFGGCSALPSLVESLDQWPGHAKLQRSS